MEQFQTLFALPQVQTGAIPFLGALLIALLLRPLGWTWSGLGLAAGFYASAYAVNVLHFTPLSSTAKLLLIGFGAVLMGLAADLYRGSRQQSFPVLFLFGAASAGWLLWPLISRQELSAIWPSVLPAIVYLGWMAAWSDAVRARPLRATGAAWVLGLTIGAACVIGASASLGQLAIALGVAAGALWLLAIAMAGLRTGSVFALTALVLAAAASLNGVFYAKIPWYSLLPLAAVPLAAIIPLPNTLSRFAEALLSAALMLPFGLLAVFLTWRISGSDSLY